MNTHERRATLVTSQLPVDLWHKMIAEPTHADAIRLVHNAYQTALGQVATYPETSDNYPVKRMATYPAKQVATFPEIRK